MSDGPSTLSPALAARLGTFEPGTVWLVGAGPGDPGLLTAYALKALGEADVIVHDALIGPDVLDLAAPGTRLISAGKRGGRPSPKQAWINERLIEEASAGYRVLRLKGGDPFVFGRGGEEALALAGAGIPFRVAPGVTAGLGGLAYAGIPATHRGMSSVVSLITGHDASGDLPDLDWDALADASRSLVFYMANRTLPSLVDRLMQGGRSPETPAAIVIDATTDRQQVIEGALATIAEQAQRVRITGPAVVVIGEVVSLRAVLRPWQQVTPPLLPPVEIEPSAPQVSVASLALSVP